MPIDRLDLTVFPVPDEAGACLRFVLSNEVNDKDAAYLHSINEGSQVLGPTQGPRGSADAAVHPASFHHRLRLRTDGGGRLRGRGVWPVGNAALPAKVDDYHDPAHSLSEP